MDVNETDLQSRIAVVPPAAVTGCVSIDATTNDNGFLNCARAGSPGAANHGSTQQAVANLMGCTAAGAKAASLIGHGNDGIIVTGTGQQANDSTKYISLWNQGVWQPHVQQLRGRVNSLALWACHPGTGDAGADFLFHLAQVVRTNVSGPTGFLYCQGGNLWLEAKSVWQVATPNSRPPAIPAPTGHLEEPQMDMALVVGSEVRRISVSRVVSARYSSTAPSRRSQGALIQLDSQEAQSLVALVDFASPFRPGGAPAALETGRLTLVVDIDRANVDRNFAVFNDKLLQDMDYPDVYYRCFSGFGRAMAAL